MGELKYGSRESERRDVIMSTMASQIASPTIVYPTVYRAQIKETSLAFLTGIQSPVNSPKKGIFIIWWRHEVLFKCNELEETYPIEWRKVS